MRLKFNFELLKLEDNTVAVPVGDNVSQFRGVIKMNETSAFIFDLLKNDMTEETILNALESEYDIPRDILAEDVKHWIKEFTERGLLV